MPKKFIAYITYGVYVDTADEIDAETEVGENFIRQQAIAKMFEHGLVQVSTSGCDIEIEDVTEEFA